MSIIWQPGQSDLELAQCDGRVLLAPRTSPALLNIEDAVAGGIDLAKVGVASQFQTVGNYEKKAGVKLANKPTINDIMSSGKGSATRKLASESKKSITYTPQEIKLLNLQNSWGFTPSAVSSVSDKGGFTIGIPELPARTQWRCVYIAWDSFQGQDVFLYWIANLAEVGDRTDITGTDSNVFEHGVTLEFQTDPAVGLPVIFGMCGAGVPLLAAAVADGSLYKSATGITVTPSTATVTVTAGATHTKQLLVKDSNGVDRTASATFTSDTPAKATVSSTGLITAVATGSANVTASWNGFTAQTTVTVSA